MIAENCTKVQSVIEVLTEMNLPFDDMYSRILESFPAYLHRLAV